MSSTRITIPTDKEGFWPWLKVWTEAKNAEWAKAAKVEYLRENEIRKDTYYQFKKISYLDIVQGDPPYVFEFWRIITIDEKPYTLPIFFAVIKRGVPSPPPRPKPEPRTTILDNREKALSITLTEENGVSNLSIECNPELGIDLDDFYLEVKRAQWPESVASTTPTVPQTELSAQEPNQEVSHGELSPHPAEQPTQRKGGAGRLPDELYDKAADRLRSIAKGRQPDQSEYGAVYDWWLKNVLKEQRPRDPERAFEKAMKSRGIVCSEGRGRK